MPPSQLRAYQRLGKSPKTHPDALLTLQGGKILHSPLNKHGVRVHVCVCDAVESVEVLQVYAEVESPEDPPSFARAVKDDFCEIFGGDDDDEDDN